MTAATAHPNGGGRLRPSVQLLLPLLGGAGVLWWLLPRISGADWSTIGTALTAITKRDLGLLAVLWAAGLLAHSFVLTGALPGLSRRRALTLNLTGSAVSNIAPMGGALGVTTNLYMTTSWGFSKASFAAFTVVTNIVDVLAKLVLPGVVLVSLITVGAIPAGPLRNAAVATMVSLAVLCALWLLLLVHEGSANRLAAVVVSTARHRLPASAASRVSTLVDGARDARDRTRTIVAGRWPQLTAGMTAYLVLQGALLWACLTVTGAGAPFTAVLAGFAVERVVSMAVITPGGTGITEAATVATIVALGGSPIQAAVGVLLHRAFIFLLEIPVGGVWLAGWLALRARTARATRNAR